MKNQMQNCIFFLDSENGKAQKTKLVVNFHKGATFNITF